MNAILNTNAALISEPELREIITQNRQGYAKAQDCLFLDYSEEHNSSDDVHWNWADWVWLRDIIKAFKEEEFDWLWYGLQFTILCNYKRSLNEQLERLNVKDKQIIIAEISSRVGSKKGYHNWYDNLQADTFTFKRIENTNYHNVLIPSIVYIKKTKDTEKFLTELYNDVRFRSGNFSEERLKRFNRTNSTELAATSCYSNIGLTIYKEGYPEYADLISGRRMSSLSKWAIKPGDDFDERLKQMDETYELKSGQAGNMILAKGKSKKMKTNNPSAYKFREGESFICGQAPSLWINLEDYINNIQAIIKLNEEG